jgi:hypothetical protein
VKLKLNLGKQDFNCSLNVFGFNVGFIIGLDMGIMKGSHRSSIEQSEFDCDRDWAV